MDTLIPECGRAWVQVARLAEAIRQLAHHLHVDQRWSKSGVLDRVFEKLQLEQIVCIKIEAIALDSTSMKVHPDGVEALR